MRNRFRDALLVVITAAVVAALSLATKSTAGQVRLVARTADGKPNLSGIWQSMNTANWDLQTHAARPALTTVSGPAGPVPAAPGLALGALGGVPGGLGVVEGNEIPYLPAAAAKKKENGENVLTRDPEVKCFLPGVPRAMYLPYPIQIIQSTTKIMMIFEYAAANRTIHLDKVEHPGVESWMGFSVGRWDGDTLVVDIVGFNEQTWIDYYGHPHTDMLHVVEKFSRPTKNVLQYEATFDDPGAYTKPFTARWTINWNPTGELTEYICQENNKYLQRLTDDFGQPVFGKKP